MYIYIYIYLHSMYTSVNDLPNCTLIISSISQPVIENRTKKLSTLQKIPSVAALDQPQSFCVPSRISTIFLSISFCFVTSMPTRAGAILSLTFWTA